MLRGRGGARRLTLPREETEIPGLFSLDCSELQLQESGSKTLEEQSCPGWRAGSSPVSPSSLLLGVQG